MTQIDWPDKYRNTLAVIQFCATMAGKSMNQYLAEYLHSHIYDFIQQTAGSGHGLESEILEFMVKDAPERY
jgi:hypothetical protein